MLKKNDLFYKVETRQECHFCGKIAFFPQNFIKFTQKTWTCPSCGVEVLFRKSSLQ